MYIGENNVIGAALGSQIGHKLYLGEAFIWGELFHIAKTLVDVNIDNSADGVYYNDPYNATLSIAMNYYLIPSSIVIKMGGVNITSQAYDSATNTISIPHVLGDVSIEAEATEIIQFEDSIAKNICVTNWGGSLVDGEITAKEASEVTDIRPVSGGDYFNRAQMVKFNEFRYFTGLTRISVATTSTLGTFQACNKMEEITLPKIPKGSTNTFNGGIFSACSALESIDLTPWDTEDWGNVYLYLYRMFYRAGVQEVDMSPFKRIREMRYMFAGTNADPCKIRKLTTTGCTFHKEALLNSAFSYARYLEIIDGGFSGLGSSVDLHYCTQLTLASAIGVLDSLNSSPVDGATVTFAASLQSTYEADAEFVLAVEDVTDNGWQVAFAST